MYLTGFADEVSQDLDKQIAVTKELGWNAIEARSVWGANIHDIGEMDFERICQTLNDSRIQINCFGSTIANWSKHINNPFDDTLAEVERAIPRMQALNTKLIRIMSYARCPGKEQHKEERFKRLREICSRFIDAGITPVHENCMNFGGMSWCHSLQLIDNVPGLKLVFDTGNPIISQDYSKPTGETQDPVEFLKNIREHVAYIHIKDARMEKSGETFLYPGDGDACIPQILQMLFASNYQGGISIEPHMASVFHDPNADKVPVEESYKIYLEYGRRLMSLLNGVGYTPSLYEEA
jgi:sugar phosphate isomerase/epimerase